jgi:cephalosporin-C deacetylase
MLATPFLSGEGETCVDHSVRLVIPGEQLPPGFYEVAFTVHATKTAKEEGWTGFGYRIDEIPLADSRPADFDAFWARGKQALASIPLNAAETPAGDMNDEEISRYNVEHASIPEDIYPQHKRADRVKVYKVQYDSWGGQRMYAWLAVPDGKGPFPGLLVLPGAGCGQVPAPVEHARHGYATLMLQIHGMDVDQEKYESPKDYMRLKGGQPEDEYFYAVCLACAQAVKYLAARPDIDPKRLAVCGGSQGGFLAVATAALCPNVRAVVSDLCYYGYWPYRDHAVVMNAAESDGMDALCPLFNRADPRQNAQSYYDAMNFAPSVRAATLMCGNLCDVPSPPTTVYAVYQRLGCKRKGLVWSPGTNHELIFAFVRRAWDWLDEQLKR